MIRKATLEDAEQIAEAHGQVWQFYEKQGGMVSDSQHVSIGGQDCLEICYNFITL